MRRAVRRELALCGDVTILTAALAWRDDNRLADSPAGVAELHLVEPLWVAVHHRHAESMPQLGPYVSDEQTWSVRRTLYEELLAKPDTLLLMAFVDDTAVGYGLAHVLAVDETWIPDTWETGSRIGEIESLSVLSHMRGSGLGSELLTRLEDHLRRPRHRRCDPRRITGQ